jgi:hypothetical protein
MSQMLLFFSIKLARILGIDLFGGQREYVNSYLHAGVNFC